MPTNKTIAIDEEVRNQLQDLKTHERETYNDVITRLIKKFGKSLTK